MNHPDPVITKRERALARVRALAAKTTDNGCTEAEAQAAVAKLNQLLQAYELTLDEATIREIEIIEHIILGKRSSLATRATWGISEFASTSFVFDNADVHIFGAPPNIEIAEYLFLLCDHAIERDTRSLPADIADDDRKNFGIGMAHRLSGRLRDMGASRAQYVQSVTGNDLIVLGRAAAQAAVEERFGNLEPENRNDDIGRRRNSSFYLSGWNAADDVALNPALQTDYQTPKQIEDIERRQRESEEAILKRAQDILLARWQANEELRRKNEAAAAEAETRRRKDEEAAALQRLRDDIEAKERAEEAEWQAVLRRRAAEQEARSEAERQRLAAEQAAQDRLALQAQMQAQAREERLRGAGARLYAAAWFATAIASVGIGGSFGVAITAEEYERALGHDLVEGRRVWAQTAVLPMATSFSPTSEEIAAANAANARVESDRQWFVNYEDCKRTTWLTCQPYGPDADAVVASFEKFHPFQPDLTNSNLIALLGAAATALAISLPVLGLALLRWLGTGRWRFSWKW